MGLLSQMNEWSGKHHPKWLVILRAILGLCLLIKGFEFIQNSMLLSEVIAKTGLFKNSSWLTILIPWVHLLGGSLIIAGLFTRAAVFIQLPILIGAVFFVNVRQGIFNGTSDLLFSIIVLLLLIIFFIEGGGLISLDNYFFNNLNKKGKGQSA